MRGTARALSQSSTEVTLRLLYFVGRADFLLETTRIQVRPQDDPQAVLFTFLTDEVAQEANESLTLQLVPTPSTLQTMPIGEAVFFKNEIRLSIMDINRKIDSLIL